MDALDSTDMQKNASQTQASQNALDPQHEKILSCMDAEPVSIDTIIQRSGLAVEVVSSILLILELNNQVIHHGNGIYIRSHSPVESPVYS